MKKSWRKSLLKLATLGLLVTGCGGSDVNFVVSDVGPPPSEQQVLEQAAADDPDRALRLVPTEHLDPLAQPTPNAQAQAISPSGSSLTVAELESNYETIFGSLSQKYGVTLESPQNLSNIAYIKAQSGTGYFDLNAQPILNNPLGVTGVNFQQVFYNTTVPLPGGSQSFEVSGGMLLPMGIDSSQVKGVIVYFHGTSFSKQGIGSTFSSGETQLCAQLFASQGYVVLIPDYVGQGSDWANVHPYVLYPKVSAQTAVDMLSAVRSVVQSSYDFAEDAPPLKLFSAGYSEGGAYSLWFNAYLRQQPEVLDSFYALTHSVGMEGAYSISGSIFDYLFNDVSKMHGNPYAIQSLALVNIVKPALSADAFLSYGTYSLGSQFDKVFQPDFFAMTATPPVPQAACNVDGENVNIADAFARPNTTVASEMVASGLGKSNNGSTYPRPSEVLLSSKNSVKSLVAEQLLQEPAFSDLQTAMKAADVDLSVCPPGAVSIISLDQDSVVVPTNFDNLLAAFPDKIRTAIKVDHSQLQVVSLFSADSAKWVAIDHLGAPPYQFLYALNSFNQF
jgi:acetyl esterase/lipase